MSEEMIVWMAWMAQAKKMLLKFALHRRDCGCFICRTLTEEDVAWLHAEGIVKD